jgi:hypothetical protein
MLDRDTDARCARGSRRDEPSLKDAPSPQSLDASPERCDRGVDHQACRSPGGQPFGADHSDVDVAAVEVENENGGERPDDVDSSRGRNRANRAL